VLAKELAPLGIRGSRFDPQKCQGKMYRARYWNDAYFDALDILRPLASKLGVTEVECALRWMTHHSKLKGEFGDGVIIGRAVRSSWSRI
jgi:aflatoxin B1 aldehyde reductase